MHMYMKNNLFALNGDSILSSNNEVGKMHGFTKLQRILFSARGSSSFQLSTVKMSSSDGHGRSYQLSLINSNHITIIKFITVNGVPIA